MRSFLYVIVSVACLFENKAISSTILNKYHTFHVCANNESISLNVVTEKKVGSVENRIICQCSGESVENQLESTLTNNGYIYTPGIGLHKLHTVAKTWNEARKICNEENAHLAIINSKAEEEVLVRMFNKDLGKVTGAVVIGQAYLGIHDMFNEGEWVTVFGESIYSAGYSEWSQKGGIRQPDNNGGVENCGTLFRIGGMNDIYCNAKLIFICERPMPC